MKKLFIILILTIVGIAFLQFGRSVYMPVINKVKEKETVESILTKVEDDVRVRLGANLKSAGYKLDYPSQIILVAYKEEQILDVYAEGADGVKLIKEYPFTAFSGKLGPKLREGDKQIPEGVYEVEYLNPNSSYYLSIKVRYPNEFDKSKTKLDHISEMGGDIFIHGKSATIGCIPLGDEAIEEVFLLVQKAINKKVKVIISPRDFRSNATYPEIEGIEWEDELYDQISEELNRIHEVD